MNEKDKVEVTLINRTDISDEELMKVVSHVCDGKKLPNFYLICQTPEHDGVTITNLDKPCVIIVVKTPQEFIKTLLHELVHLKQHALNYASEEEVELVITDKYETMNDKIRACAGINI